mmetsp:Transcript_16821/g.47915  ORF Transcript_16821/g.47915 Transcript_16821/m.47915 type:complete len:120 (-) Transcript_16821:47-406(-)
MVSLSWPAALPNQCTHTQTDAIVATIHNKHLTPRSGRVESHTAYTHTHTHTCGVPICSCVVDWARRAALNVRMSGGIPREETKRQNSQSAITQLIILLQHSLQECPAALPLTSKVPIGT